MIRLLLTPPISDLTRIPALPQKGIPPIEHSPETENVSQLSGLVRFETPTASGPDLLRQLMECAP
jgi:hypothetical protein